MKKAAQNNSQIDRIHWYDLIWNRQCTPRMLGVGRQKKERNVRVASTLVVTPTSVAVTVRRGQCKVCSKSSSRYLDNQNRPMYSGEQLADSHFDNEAENQPVIPYTTYIHSSVPLSQENSGIVSRLFSIDSTQMATKQHANHSP